jgi:TetR/AcrR family acrAB operon transcriptional repressor
MDEGFPSTPGRSGNRQRSSAAARGNLSRAELTRIAVECFAHHGFKGTSVDRIARAAGVTKGALYHHFRDKEALLGAAVADRIAAFEGLVQAACRGLEPDAALIRIADLYIEQARSKEGARFVITLIVENLDEEGEVTAQLREMMHRFRGFLRSIVRNGQNSGLFRADADAGAVAASYTSTILGAEIQYYQDPDRFRFDEAISTWLEQMLLGLRSPANEG